jgi:hypothetical protein
MKRVLLGVPNTFNEAFVWSVLNKHVREEEVGRS